MARKLKTFQTSLGFFDQAIAAPSMKAALEAWGADSNLFHQGAAKESQDPDVIAATMAKPGVVLKRGVGSKALQRTRRPAEQFGRRWKAGEGCSQAGKSEAEAKCSPDRRQGGGAEGRSLIRTGADATRSRTGQRRGHTAEGT
jgi:hypothetical protein